MLSDVEIAQAKELVELALHDVYDPEIGINIVDLGLIYGIDIDQNGFLTITMTLTTPGCPMHESIGEGVGQAVQEIKGITGGTIDLVWDPPWSTDMMTPEGKGMLGLSV